MAAESTTYRGRYEQRDLWWDDPTETDRHYRDINGVRWVIRREEVREGSDYYVANERRTLWRARPTDAAGLRRYGVAAGRWPIEAVDFGGPMNIATALASLRKGYEATAESIDDFVGKKQPFPWWLLAAIAVLSRKRRR